MKRNFYILIICTFLIALWAYAALSKLTSYEIFAAQLNLQPIPEWSIPIIKWGLPIVELGSAILIYIQNTRLLGLITSTSLMLIFTIYVALALTGAFGDIPCSCAGIISGMNWEGHLIFNIIFLIMSVTGVNMEKNKDFFLTIEETLII